MSTPPQHFAALLEAAHRGDREASDALLALAYGELHRLASRLLAEEGRNDSLQTTMIVNDAWMNLMGEAGGDFENRRHFFGAAARAMRRILVDHARSREALRRGGGHLRLDLPDHLPGRELPDTSLLGLHEALAAFETAAPEIAQVVELRYFAGLTLEEVGRSTGRSLATIKREWTYARAWLHDWMRRQGP